MKPMVSGRRNFVLKTKLQTEDIVIHCPSALSELPKMLGLEELKKGYFPHLFNRKENQSVVLNHLPDVHYYNPDATSSPKTVV
jgi:hypothetical protein